MMGSAETVEVHLELALEHVVAKEHGFGYVSGYEREVEVVHAHATGDVPGHARTETQPERMAESGGTAGLAKRKIVSAEPGVASESEEAENDFVLAALYSPVHPVLLETVPGQLIGMYVARRGHGLLAAARFGSHPDVAVKQVVRKEFVRESQKGAGPKVLGCTDAAERDTSVRRRTIQSETQKER